MGNACGTSTDPNHILPTQYYTGYASGTSQHTCGVCSLFGSGYVNNYGKTYLKGGKTYSLYGAYVNFSSTNTSESQSVVVTKSLNYGTYINIVSSSSLLYSCVISDNYYGNPHTVGHE